MKIYYEKNLSRFEFWGNAKRNAEMISESEFNTIESALEEIFPNGIDETQLNDLFAFDFDWVCEAANLEINL